MSMTPADIRAYFPGTARRTHFNSAGLTPGCTPATAAIQRFLATLADDPAKAYRGGDHEKARAEAARLVGGKVHQIALVPATTQALNIGADAIPLESGDNVVTCDLEFMSVVVPWLEKCRTARAELRVAKHRQGVIDPADVIALIDGRTRAVVLSAVQWTNGFRLDLAPIGVACRARGVPFFVDAIQQLGVVPFDVTDVQADYVTCGGHKWLCSPSAMGLAWISDDFAKRYRPTLSYAPTSAPPGDGWIASWTTPDYDPIRTYDLNPDASRFEIGVHHAALGAAGLAASLGMLNGFGIDRIAEHVFTLGDRVAREMTALGCTVVTPLGHAHRSGITTFRAGATAADDLALRDALAAENIDVAVRYTSNVGGVRVACHLFNNDADVDRLVDVVRRWKVA